MAVSVKPRYSKAASWPVKGARGTNPSANLLRDRRNTREAYMTRGKGRQTQLFLVVLGIHTDSQVKFLEKITN